MDGSGCTTGWPNAQLEAFKAGANESRINSMNSDILSHIFLFLSHSEVDTNWEWVVVAEVCRQWHAVAVETPKLWSFLRKFNSGKRTRRHLQLSKNAELTVYFSDNSSGSKVAPEVQVNLARNLRMVLKELHRVKHLYVSAHGLFCLENLDDILDSPAPRIRTIHLDHFYLYMRPASLFASNSLRSLTLNGCGSKNISALHGLQHLSVSSTIINLSILGPTLEACPGLITLSIVFCNLNNSSPEPKKIYLPYLRKLRVHDDDFYGCLKLMHIIDAPNVACLDVYSRYISPTEIDDIAVISKFISKDHPCESTHISFSRDLKVMINRRPWLDDDDYGLAVSVGFRRMPVESRERIFDVVREYLTESESLYISDPRSSASPETLFSAFQRSMSVKHLTIELMHNLGESRCFEALIPLEETSIPCPKLVCSTIILQVVRVRLALLPDDFLDALETLIRRRSECGSAVHKVILKSSNVLKCGKGRMERLRNIVGDLTLECDIKECLEEEDIPLEWDIMESSGEETE